MHGWLKKSCSFEDDHVISEMYSRALLTAGYEVEAAYNGNDGLMKAQTGQFR